MIVVGIRTSAGDQETLLPFVSHLPTDIDISLIIVQHGSSNQSGLLAELLEKASTLPVCVAKNECELEPKRVYVVPYNSGVSIENGRIKITASATLRPLQSTVDFFFNSLAQNYREKAIAIVFASTGSDGADGLKAVKAAGGITMTMAQFPKTAKFSCMPNAAIEYADVDLTVGPEEAANKLTVIADRLLKTSKDVPSVPRPDGVKSLIDRIFDETGMDFINYKRSTINRQILRRMAILETADFNAYLDHCENNPEELTRLANNFLVCVTSFFRDEASFNVLKKALQTIIRGKSYGDEIRIWVPGCATGEEAYSIAIILLEELGAHINRYRVQIYGTDINANAVQIARKGEYSESALRGLSRRIRETYFQTQERGYMVNRNLRDLVMFSCQDLVRNPPFIRLDLISCRNLLIYLTQTLQEQVLKIFHYALQNNGILFLGQAESLWKLSDAFSQLDSNNKLFIKNNALVIRPDFSTKKMNQFSLTSEGGIHSNCPPYQILGQEILVKTYAPPSILATRDGRILEFFNDCGKFIIIKQGKADFNLFSLVEPVFKSELRAFCHQALSTNSSVSSPPLTLISSGNSCNFRLTVIPVYHQQANDQLILVSFEQLPERNAAEPLNDEEEFRVTGLEHELRISRETLKTVTEALENSVSEWQTLNEEAQTTNEELQSTNEELETSNEELQSINEELTLVNDELTLKTKELGNLSDDLRNILESIGIAVIVIDKRMQITRYNRLGSRFLQQDPVTSVNPNISSLENLFGSEQLIHYARTVIEQRQNAQYRLTRDARHFELTLYPYRSHFDNRVTGVVLTIEDITESYLAEQQIRLAASVYEAANEAIVITNKKNRIISVNSAFSAITGYSKSEVLGKDPKILNSGMQNQEFYRDLWTTLKKQGRWQGKIWNKRKNGEIYAEWLSISALKDSDREISKYVGVFADISETLRTQQLIEKQANYDALTNLPNRTLFNDRLHQAMSHAHREQKLFGLMFIDLDGFKNINDALGHSQGDLVLQEIASRMKHLFRESDTFARFGGDEFTVLIPDLESETDMIAPTEKMLEIIERPIKLNDHELHITASIGITIYPNDGQEAETLLKHADNAMYTAKAEGRNTYRFFTQEMHEKAKFQHRIANDIKNAIKLGLFSVHYQPVIDLHHHRLCGAEALIRWHHPIRGFIPPEEFIPVAESLNLMTQIGEFVLSRACHYIAILNSDLNSNLSIAVNFSSMQFIGDDCAEKWLQIIESSGLNFNNVVVEITESLMMNHKEHYIRQLKTLRSKGIKIALDDFGTGYSSLSYLKTLPVDIIKIDRSFIRDVLFDSSDASLVESILDIAQNFSLEVIAEGVEKAGHVEFLKARPCGYAQGYYYSKPLPEEKFKQFVLSNNVFGE